MRKQKRIIEEKNAILFKQNEEISSQKEEIESQRDLVTSQKDQIEKIHNEVSQSIDYATRLQLATLPDNRILMKIVPDHFILYKPKDKVSGDFYWWAIVENHLVIAVADCTGHGVPGAFMSMLGNSFLREIVVKEYMTVPDIILKRLRKEIIYALKQKGTTGEQKDGMDIALISINIETLQMQFAGANNPCWIIRKTSEIQNGLTFHEIKGDKMPVAIHENMQNFTNHKFQLQKGDCIFLSTDGYKDQFGGSKNKKIMVKQMKEVVLNIADKPMNELLGLLNDFFENWKGQLDQIDDVTVIGLRI